MANNIYLDHLNQQQGGNQGNQGVGMDSLKGMLNLSPDEASQMPPTQPGQEQPNITEVGQTGDQTTKPLIMAMNALNTFLSASGDRQEIVLVKSILQVLSKIVARNQAMGMQNTQEQGGQEQIQGQPGQQQVEQILGGQGQIQGQGNLGA